MNLLDDIIFLTFCSHYRRSQMECFRFTSIINKIFRTRFRVTFSSFLWTSFRRRPSGTFVFNLEPELFLLSCSVKTTFFFNLLFDDFFCFFLSGMYNEPVHESSEDYQVRYSGTCLFHGADVYCLAGNFISLNCGGD